MVISKESFKVANHVACFLLLFLAPFGIAQWNPNFLPGRTAMVHLFEWRWEDIALECERFLGPRGFAGVQVSPPNENAVINSPFRPWYERYQPVSFKLETRSGNEAQFIEMVQRCNAVGVRIYVDTVINHMTGNSVYGVGTGGSTFDARNYDFPGVPYSRNDFNDNTTCPTASGEIEDWDNVVELRNCQFVKLIDLNHGKEHVREVISAYMNKLIDIGVAGFRVDLAKHMWPGDLTAIFNRLHDLPASQNFPPNTRPFIVQEVTDVGSHEPIRASEYHQNGRTTEFRFGIYLGEIFRKLNGHKLSTLRNYGEQWGLYPDNNVLVFVDNHDNQRGHGASGDYILTFRQAKLYKMAQAFTLAWNYGTTRVMSSYYWEQDFGEDGKDKNDWVGPPNVDGVTSGVVINPDLTCGGGWICEHRWRQIMHMVEFRNVVDGTDVNNWWDNGQHQIAFSRGSKGFIAINNEDSSMVATIQTGLPAGVYCDVISGAKQEDGSCSGKTIIVNDNGTVNINISHTEEDPIIAIHV